MNGKSLILEPLLRVLAIVIATVLALSILVLSWFYHDALHDLDGMNNVDLNVLLTTYAAEGEEGLSIAIDSLTAFDYQASPAVFIEYIQQQTLAENHIYTLNAVISERGTITIDNQQFRARALMLAENEYLIIGRDTAHIWRQMGGLTALILFAALLASLLCFFYLYSRQKRQDKRIYQLVVATQDIGKGHLNVNVPQSHNYDELDRIAEAVEYMASNIKRRIEEHQQFSSQLAHELRMPLARLSDSLCEQDAEQSNSDWINARIVEVSNALQDIMELSAIRNEQDTNPPLESCLPGGLVDDALALYEDLAKENGITVKTSIDLKSHTQLNPVLFKRLIINLIENALRHTPSGGHITVCCNTENGLVFSIENSSSAFPDSLLSQISMQPFAVNKFDGHGKGLAFVSAIADYHNWQFELSNTQVGAKVTISAQQS